MKNTTYSLILLLLLASSCRKVIEINQEDGDKNTVIEAILYEGSANFEVKVTETGNFFGNNATVPITDASVVVNDGTSNFSFSNNGDGTYSLSSAGFLAVSGNEYTLTVSENGKTYVAKSIMPAIVPIDTITTEFQEASLFSDSGFIAQIEFIDPGNVVNYYRLLVNVAGTNYGGIENLILLDDGFLNGNRIEFPLFAVEVAQLNDVISMELISIDEATSFYLDGVDDLISGGNGAPPGNPKGNFSNGALGNFSLYASDRKTIVVTR